MADRVPREPAGVAAPVEALVMIPDERLDDGVEATELAHDRDADLGMGLDLVVLRVRQIARLAEHLVRDSELADAVKQPADRERAETARRQAEHLADL